VVLVLTAINLRGARWSAATQTVTSLVPFVAFLGLALLALTIGGPAPLPETTAPARGSTAGDLALSYSAVYFAYSGWINVIYVAGEVRRPSRNIPFALLGGTLLVTALYLVICVALVRCLGMPGLARAGEAGSALAERVAGTRARFAVTACIAIALTASINATVLGGARILRAMAKGGAAMSWFAHEGRPGVPARTLLAQAGWSIVLILSGGFQTLLQMVSVAMVVTGSLTVASLFVLRRRQPDELRPFRATAYPWLPAVYLIANLVVIVVMIHGKLSGEHPDWLPLLGLFVTVVAYAGHAAYRKRRAS
jgi:basic amino acid/polyamine antiporter, APA family